MIINVNSKTAKDLVNNWSVGGRTQHKVIGYLYLLEAKETSMVKIEWIPSTNNRSDSCTKH
jgi:hypothetical protein